MDKKQNTKTTLARHYFKRANQLKSDVIEDIRAIIEASAYGSIDFKAGIFIDNGSNELSNMDYDSVYFRESNNDYSLDDLDILDAITILDILQGMDFEPQMGDNKE